MPSGQTYRIMDALTLVKLNFFKTMFLRTVNEIKIYV